MMLKRLTQNLAFWEQALGPVQCSDCGAYVESWARGLGPKACLDGASRAGGAQPELVKESLNWLLYAWTRIRRAPGSRSIRTLGPMTKAKGKVRTRGPGAEKYKEGNPLLCQL